MVKPLSIHGQTIVDSWSNHCQIYVLGRKRIAFAHRKRRRTQQTVPSGCAQMVQGAVSLRVSLNLVLSVLWRKMFIHSVPSGCAQMIQGAVSLRLIADHSRLFECYLNVI